MQGQKPGWPTISAPALATWKPSTSLAGEMASITLLRVDVRGQRQLHQDAVDRRVVVERVDARQQLGFGQVGRVALQRRVQAGVCRWP